MYRYSVLLFPFTNVHILVDKFALTLDTYPLLPNFYLFRLLHNLTRFIQLDPIEPSVLSQSSSPNFRSRSHAEEEKEAEVKYERFASFGTPGVGRILVSYHLISKHSFIRGLEF